MTTEEQIADIIKRFPFLNDPDKFKIASDPELRLIQLKKLEALIHEGMMYAR